MITRNRLASSGTYRLTQKGALYTCECMRCGNTEYTHEWVHSDHNDRRDAMQDGTLHCSYCLTGTVHSFGFAGLHYAAVINESELNVEYGTNRKALERYARSIAKPRKP